MHRSRLPEHGRAECGQQILCQRDGLWTCLSLDLVFYSSCVFAPQKCEAEHGRVRKGYCLITMFVMDPTQLHTATHSLPKRASRTDKVFWSVLTLIVVFRAARYRAPKNVHCIPKAPGWSVSLQVMRSCSVSPPVTPSASP